MTERPPLRHPVRVAIYAGIALASTAGGTDTFDAGAAGIQWEWA